ncbi:MAG TPA: FAD-dependent oxidoreductase [Thermoleophilaceae bacterium]|nr:FAD-dependent oxidoreductase [Thermoleophilaceae bacterium]
MTDLIVAGAGMAGLVAAARARELGASVVVYEKGGRIGGSMRLSSGVIWRYSSFDEFRSQCPDGDSDLQRVVHEQLDQGLDWLASLGAVVADPSTGNPLTVGRRFDTASLCEVLARGLDVRLSAPLAAGSALAAPCILATGGFQADSWLVREWITAQPLLLRSNPGSTGDGLRIGLDAGGVYSSGMDQFYGRAMPAVASLDPAEWVQSAQLYARHAVAIENAAGRRYPGEVDWAELHVVQWIARQPGARAWFVVPPDALELPTRYGTVGEQISRARAIGAAVEQRDQGVAVEVVAAITQTLGGLRVDRDGRVLRGDGSAVAGLWAAGGDVGGVATGGYMSNLAAALVIGKRAAESALAAA